MEKSVRTNASRRKTASMDAIALLKADHRQVEKWFAEFRKSRAAGKKGTLAEQICNALKVHTIIEEELFYPAFLEARATRTRTTRPKSSTRVPRS